MGAVRRSAIGKGGANGASYRGRRLLFGGMVAREHTVLAEKALRTSSPRLNHHVEVIEASAVVFRGSGETEAGSAGEHPAEG